MSHAAFRAFIDAHVDFLILSHIAPDGDAVGFVSFRLKWIVDAFAGRRNGMRPANPS